MIRSLWCLHYPQSNLHVTYFTLARCTRTHTHHQHMLGHKRESGHTLAHLCTSARAQARTRTRTHTPPPEFTHAHHWTRRVSAAASSLSVATVLFIHGSECGRDRPGLDCAPVTQKLGHIQYNSILNILKLKTKIFIILYSFEL